MDDVIRILLVDDHEVVRIGLKALLERHDGLLVVGEAKGSTDATEQAFRLNPDLILMDLRLPDGSGVEAIQSIKEKLPHTQILVLTAFSRSSSCWTPSSQGLRDISLRRSTATNWFRRSARSPAEIRSSRPASWRKPYTGCDR